VNTFLGGGLKFVMERRQIAVRGWLICNSSPPWLWMKRLPDCGESIDIPVKDINKVNLDIFPVETSNCVDLSKENGNPRYPI
jgi:hypothetical protein